MQGVISRRKLAKRSARRIAAGDSKQAVLNELAAYLIDTKRVRESELIVRDIEAALANERIVVATVTSARKLSGDSIKAVRSYIANEYTSSAHIDIRQVIDESLLAGMKIELPGKVLDTSVKTKLEKLTV